MCACAGSAHFTLLVTAFRGAAFPSLSVEGEFRKGVVGLITNERTLLPKLSKW